jgi:1-acyl-sn-glycerol-3-phosphate acyltransferase
VPEALGLGVWIAGGVAAGSLLAGLQRHRRRALGLVPLGASGLLLGLLGVALIGGPPQGWVGAALGVAAGLVTVPLAVSAAGRSSAGPRHLAAGLLLAVLAGAVAGLGLFWGLSAEGGPWLLAGLAAAGAAAAWWWLTRNFLEQVLEWVVLPFYRIRGHGPGLAHFPLRGPVLVISNHTAWFDPVWLGKVLPRKLTPMMTSVFYDLPVLRWLMRNVVGAIRVQAATFRREAPELVEAIRVLDRGGCVVIFPEGSCRKNEKKVLRHFGQGVWHILHERPGTPVVVCWIEGGWGSYWSYVGGPPTKNKRLDFWRPIRVAARDPEVLRPEVLDDMRQTRTHLYQACLEARRHLGLPPLAADEGGEEGGRPAPEDTPDAVDGAGRP